MPRVEQNACVPDWRVAKDWTEPNYPPSGDAPLCRLQRILQESSPSASAGPSLRYNVTAEEGGGGEPRLHCIPGEPARRKEEPGPETHRDRDAETHRESIGARPRYQGGKETEWPLKYSCGPV